MECKCYGCEKRTAGCHATCEDYIKYREFLDAEREKGRVDREIAGLTFRARPIRYRNKKIDVNGGYKND